MKIKAIILLSVLILCSKTVSSQLISDTQIFKEDFTISKYKNDKNVASIINYIAVISEKDLSKIKYTIEYKIEINDSLHFYFEKPYGDIKIAGYDVGEYMVPDTIIIYCGDAVYSINTNSNRQYYCFKRPKNISICDCKFIYSDTTLNNFYKKTEDLNKIVALYMLTDAITGIINNFQCPKQFCGFFVNNIILFVDSQLEYIKAYRDSVINNYPYYNSKNIDKKITSCEGRRNYILMSYSDSTNNIVIDKTIAEELADLLMSYYDTICKLSKNTDYHYSNEFMDNISFSICKPDIEKFAKSLRLSANAYTNKLNENLLSRAYEEYYKGDISMVQIMINNYEYLCKDNSNKHKKEFTELQIMCYDKQMDNYIKLAELFYNKGNEQLSDQYFHKYKEILAKYNKIRYGE